MSNPLEPQDDRQVEAQAQTLPMRPLDYAQLRQSAEHVRHMAYDYYYAALRKYAEDKSEKNQQELDDAKAAADASDHALRSIMESEVAFRMVSIGLANGDTAWLNDGLEGTQRKAKSAGSWLAKAGDFLDTVSVRLKNIQSDFSAKVKVFSDKVKAFGQEISTIVDRALALAKERKTSVAEVAPALLASVTNNLKARRDSIVESAAQTFNRLTSKVDDALSRMNKLAQAAATTAAMHAEAIGRTVSDVASAASDAYQRNLQDALNDAPRYVQADDLLAGLEGRFSSAPANHFRLDWLADSKPIFRVQRGRPPELASAELKLHADAMSREMYLHLRDDIAACGERRRAGEVASPELATRLEATESEAFLAIYAAPFLPDPDAEDGIRSAHFEMHERERG